MSKKTPPPPLVDVKYAYEDALAAALLAANMLAVGVDAALKLNQVSPKVEDRLRQLTDSFHKAYFGDKS